MRVISQIFSVKAKIECKVVAAFNILYIVHYTIFDKYQISQEVEFFREANKTSIRKKFFRQNACFFFVKQTICIWLQKQILLSTCYKLTNLYVKLSNFLLHLLLGSIEKWYWNLVVVFSLSRKSILFLYHLMRVICVLFFHKNFALWLSFWLPIKPFDRVFEV